MKIKYTIQTSKCAFVGVPKDFDPDQFASDIRHIATNGTESSRLKDGIEVGYDSLEEALKENEFDEEREFIEACLKLKVDTFLFHL